MPVSGGTAAAGLSAAQRSNKDAAPEDLLQSGKFLNDATPAVKKVSHKLTAL
jgi:hypothetical protein